MNNHFLFKLFSLILVLLLHEKTIFFDFFQPNWLVLMVCYWAATNDKYSVLPFFIAGLTLDIIYSETLGFYSLFFVSLGGVLSYFRAYFLTTDLLKQISLIFIANIYFLIYLNFMNLVNGAPFISPDRWFSVLITTVIWLPIQVIFIAKYLNKINSYG